jgi:hypothetical protein
MTTSRDSTAVLVESVVGFGGDGSKDGNANARKTTRKPAKPRTLNLTSQPLSLECDTSQEYSNAEPDIQTPNPEIQTQTSGISFLLCLPVCVRATFFSFAWCALQNVHALLRINRSAYSVYKHTPVLCAHVSSFPHLILSTHVLWIFGCAEDPYRYTPGGPASPDKFLQNRGRVVTIVETPTVQSQSGGELGGGVVSGAGGVKRPSHSCGLVTASTTAATSNLSGVLGGRVGGSGFVGSRQIDKSVDLGGQAHGGTGKSDVGGGETEGNGDNVAMPRNGVGGDYSADELDSSEGETSQGSGE